MFALVATGGLFVASENLTVMVSPDEKTVSPLSGSAIINEIIFGPSIIVIVLSKDAADTLPAASVAVAVMV